MDIQELERIAKRAAELYGQVWNDLPAHSMDAWREAVRHANPSGRSDIPMVQCAINALREYLISDAMKNVKPIAASHSKEEVKSQVVKETPKGKGK